MRALLFLVCLSIAGCGTAIVAVDAAAVDAGNDVQIYDLHDANDRDANDRDANDIDAAVLLDANDIDANDIDAAVLLDANDVDALDANIPTDIGPFDSGIARTADPSTHPTATPIAPFTECTVTTFHDTIVSADHRTPCSPIPYPSYPPSAGPHYDIWANYRTYASPIPWGFLVHDLEHGAVILAYHCENDADCAAVRTEMASIVTDRGLDDVCRVEMESNPSRFIIVADPLLPVPIAAVAWRNVYEATCLDPASLRAFVTAHYGMGTEAICYPGIDSSDGGWCP